MYTLHTKIGGHLANKVDGSVVVVHKVNIIAPAGNKLKTYAAGSGKQIKYADRFKINNVGKDIKKCLPGKIRSRSGIKSLAYLYFSALIFSANNTQVFRYKRFRYLYLTTGNKADETGCNLAASL